MDVVRYWDAFYRNRSANLEPSHFARFVKGRFPERHTLIDVGCGDGRDALWFDSHGWNVIGLDASQSAIEMCVRIGEASGARCKFLSMTIGKDSLSNILLEHLIDAKHTIIFARFLLHAISEEEERILLTEISPWVARGAKLCVEARSIEDRDLPKVEAPHYRRFIAPQHLEQRCCALDMRTELLLRGRGMAPYAFEDPEIVRAIFGGGPG